MVCSILALPVLGHGCSKLGAYLRVIVQRCGSLLLDCSTCLASLISKIRLRDGESAGVDPWPSLLKCCPDGTPGTLKSSKYSKVRVTKSGFRGLLPPKEP